MSKVPVFDYLEQYRALREEILRAVEQVFGSGRLILGPQVQVFEEAFSRFLSETGESVAVNSGTDALAITLMACGVGPGDEVVTVANTAVPTVSAIRMTGATPVFCDVDPQTALMDLGLLPTCLTSRTRAVIPVHLFGNVVDVGLLRNLVSHQGIRIIEDCAQAHGARLRGRSVGTLGDAAAFSFYPTKNLGAFGDAGLCFSPDPRLVEEMRKIRMYGFENAYYSEREGINSRMDELQAAILNVKLPHLADYLSRRRYLANCYDQLLDPGIQRFSTTPNAEHAYHLYVIRLPARDALRSALQEHGVATGIHYPYPIHLMRGYRFLGYPAGALPVTESLAREILSLPLYPELNESGVQRVCHLLNALYRAEVNP